MVRDLEGLNGEVERKRGGQGSPASTMGSFGVRDGPIQRERYFGSDIIKL